MESTTLVIMAAGMGSRFGGGIKQLEPMGPNGEIIMDYSIYDAIEAGFNKVVFVTRRDLLETFKEVIGNRIEKVIPVEYVFQEIEDLPSGYTAPAERTKPWGTGQAILACKGTVKEPFLVINADDYYGKTAFKLIHDYLVEDHTSDKKYDFCMAGFILGNTLSDNGAVTRGICVVDDEEHLIGVKETGGIVKTETGAECEDGNGNIVPCDPKSHVSMNMWGFTPDFLDVLEDGFKTFLGSLKEGDIKSEYLLPSIVDSLIKDGEANVSVLETTDKWFGVTYKEDKPVVVESIRRLIEEGKYPESLYK
ncbi:MAG: nucleotidyltransferase [Eubacteriales bacterium]|nr:nucleotidyltransferase [Eubacteriales bacterium]